MASATFGSPISITRCSRPSGNSTCGISRFSTVSSFSNSFCKPMSNLMASCAALIACSRSSSETSFASPSTIVMESSEPATTSSKSASSSWLMVGLMRYSPLIRPTRTVAIGPAKGISEITSAAEAPNPAKTSGSFSLSMESTLAII